MPMRHARSETRGRPPFGRDGAGGRSGSTRSHNASGSSVLKQRVEQFENSAKILQSVASGFDENSKEYAAIKEATIALWYVLAEDHERFQEYVNKFHGELTPEQRAHLVSLGIDPDVDPTNDNGM
jgi:hypothetical protein